MPFLYGYQSQSKVAQHHTDSVEVFISGRGFPHNIAQVASRTTRQLVLASSGQLAFAPNIGGQMLYLHRVDLPLLKGATYQVYTPK